MAYLKKSRYYNTNTRLQSKRNVGFDYSNKILQNCVSSHLLSNDIIFNTFSHDINNILENNLNNIKDLKKFYAYSINKHDYDIN